MSARSAQLEGPPVASRRWAFVRRGLVRLQPVAPPAILTALLALVPFDTCLARRFLHVPCPGCGFTRAALALAHGRVRDSLALHPLVLPALALGLVSAVVAMSLPERHPAWHAFSIRATQLAAAALLACWALRIAGVLAPV